MAEIWVHEDCRPWLEAALREGFAAVPAEARRTVPGRTDHFVYAPAGAPFRAFVRRVVRGGWLSFLGSLHLGTARVRREKASLERAAASGLTVPELIGYRIDRALVVFRRMVCVYREIPGMKTLDRALEDSTFPERAEQLRRVGEVVRRMHDARIRHGDLNARNILVGERITLVDFDRAASLRGSGLGELVRLFRSLHKVTAGGFGRKDRARILLGYAGSREEFRSLFRRAERRLAVQLCLRGMR